MNPAMTNLGIMLFMMQVSKKISFDDPQTLLYVRALYVFSNVLIISLYLYTKMKINQKNDLTTLKYVEPPSAFQGNTDSKMVTTTIKEYDSQQVNSCFKGMIQGVAMMAFMHLYMGYGQPLLLQSILPVKSAFEQNIVQIHVFGKPATGDRKRPFKAASIFGAPSEAKTDKKAIDEAETSGKGGVKQD